MTAPSPSCGSCRACCVALDVQGSSPFPWTAPAGRPCPFSSPGPTDWTSTLRRSEAGACRIYDVRPQACRDFKCLWLERALRSPSDPPPMELRPDHSGVILDAVGRSISARVDPARPDAWRSDVVLPVLERAAHEGITVIVSPLGNPTRRKVLTAAGPYRVRIRDETFTPVDPATGLQFLVPRSKDPR